MHEKGLRITYQDNTSTFQELLKDNSVSMHHRNFHVLTTEIIHRGLSAEILRETFVSKTSLYNLLRNNTFEIRQVHSDSIYQGTETLSFLGLKILDLVPVELNNQRTSKLNAHSQVSDNFWQLKAV